MTVPTAHQLLGYSVDGEVYIKSSHGYYLTWTNRGNQWKPELERRNWESGGVNSWHMKRGPRGLYIIGAVVDYPFHEEGWLGVNPNRLNDPAHFYLSWSPGADDWESFGIESHDGAWALRSMVAGYVRLEPWDHRYWKFGDSPTKGGWERLELRFFDSTNSGEPVPVPST